MEKIEKLEGSYDVPQLKQKLNEIIDILNSVMFRPTLIVQTTNSQDQEEEKPLKELEDNYLYSLRTANKPMSQDQEEEKIEYFDKGDKVRTYKSLEVSEKAYSEEPTVEDVYIEDTPEQKEEWEEDTRIIVPPSFYKELKKHKYNMKKYIKSKLIKIKDKS